MANELLRIADAIDPFTRKHAPDHLTMAAAAKLLRSLATPPAATQVPHPGSPEASAMMDSVLNEYHWPANPKNAARAGWVAATRYLALTQSAPPAAQQIGGVDLMKSLAWAMARIEQSAPHRAEEGDGVLYEFAAARAALKKAQQ